MFYQGLTALILLIIAPSIALAQNLSNGVIGVSAFGMQSPNFQETPCEVLRNSILIQKTPTISILYNSFGKDNTCLYRFWDAAYYQQGKKHITQIHFSNEVGRKNSFMSPFGFQRKYNTKQYNDLLERMPDWLETDIRNRVRKIYDLIDYYQDTGMFILGAGLEDLYTQKAFNNLYRILREEWPFTISRNPTYMNSTIERETPRAVFLEYHHYKNWTPRNKCILNGDGQDISFAPGSNRSLKGIDKASKREVQNWANIGKRNNCIMFIWTGKWQGLKDGGVPEPSKRKFRWEKKDVTATKRLINRLNRGTLLRKGGRKKKKRR